MNLLLNALKELLLRFNFLSEVTKCQNVTVNSA